MKTARRSPQKTAASCLNGYDPNNTEEDACQQLCNSAKDGQIESGEYCDDNDDGIWNYPEPFEDFLIIYNPSASDPNNRWIRLDPSFRNPSSDSRAWAEAYIRANYPGDNLGKSLVDGDGDGYADTPNDGFLGRFGNMQYDGPDAWSENGGSSKMQLRAPDAEMGSTTYVAGKITPAPNDSIWPWSLDLLVAELLARPAPDERRSRPKTSPPHHPRRSGTRGSPTWTCLIRALPSQKALGRKQSGNPRSFHPNTGGTRARTGTSCEPTLPTETEGCTFPTIDPLSPGNGSVNNDALGGSGSILPDELDTDFNGIPDYYDGPAEYDDLPSSIYHARNYSGIGGMTYSRSTNTVNIVLGGGSPQYGNGGDGNLGEVTSPRNAEMFGQDFGAGYPDSPSGPDGEIPPAGPLAYNIHGTNGFDAGNQLNLELLTWRRRRAVLRCTPPWPFRMATSG